MLTIASGTISVIVYSLIKKLFPKKSSNVQNSKIYEEKALVDQYMLFNFSEGKEFLSFDLNENSDVNNCFLFPKRIALLCRDYCPDLFQSDQVSISIFLLFKIIFLFQN